MRNECVALREELTNVQFQGRRQDFAWMGASRRHERLGGLGSIFSQQV